MMAAGRQVTRCASGVALIAVAEGTTAVAERGEAMADGMDES